MAIQINGNGTITGISVGGLPNGIVDTDMIAANAVTKAKRTHQTGEIIQTKFFVYTNTTWMADTNGWHATPVTVQITPTSASNKILVMATVTCSGNNGGRFFIGFKRGSTAIGDGDASGSRIAGVTTGTEQVGGETIDSLSISFLDSPSSTSEQTYKLTGCAEGSNTFRLNRSPNDTDGTNTARGASTITVMEVLP